MRTFYDRTLPPGDAAPATRVVTITDDGKDYRYHPIQRSERADFKRWAESVFAGGMNCKRLTGAWPNYEVKQPS